MRMREGQKVRRNKNLASGCACICVYMCGASLYSRFDSH